MWLIKSVINIFIDLVKVLDIVSSVLPQTQSLSTLSKTQIGCVLDFSFNFLVTALLYIPSLFPSDFLNNFFSFGALVYFIYSKLC